MSNTTAEWLIEISTLTVGHGLAPDADPEVLDARGRQLAAELAAAAAAFVAARGCDVATGHHTCALSELDGGVAACRLAAAIASGAPAVTDVPTAAPRAAARHYLHALRAASTVVIHCRRHAHPAGECWFSAAGVEDGHCADALALAHRLTA